MRRKLILGLFGILVALGASSLAGSPVLAHNTFSDSSPREGEVLAIAPLTWSVTFTKSVPLDSASGSVINGDGTRASLASPRHGTSDNTIVFDLPPGLAGSISARWRLVSSDGHVISGRISFSVQGTVTDPSAVVVDTTNESFNEPGGTPDGIRVALRLANFGGIVLLGGLLFIDFDIAAGALGTRRGRKLALWAAGLLAAIPVAQFLIFVDDINVEGKGMLSAAGDALSMTAGAMLFVRIIAGLVLAWLTNITVRIGTVDRSMIFPVGIAAATYLIALAYVGHSRSQAAPWLGVPIDVLHTASVAVWLGGLVAILFVVAPAVDSSGILGAFSRFSFVAERAVAVIAITGVIQMTRLHGNPINLFSSGHGLLLLAKVVAVAVMIRLAMKNRHVLQRHQASTISNDDRSRTLLLRSTTTEVLCGAIALSLTAILVAVSPS